MTDTPQPQPSPGAAPRRPAARPNRRKRFAMTLAGAAAGFVIVFQFLALQLQAGKDPVIGGSVATGSQASHMTSAPATGGSAPVVTRTSAGGQSVPVSSTQVPATTGSTPKQRTAHHAVVTHTSGSGTSGRGQSDDLD